MRAVLLLGILAVIASRIQVLGAIPTFWSGSSAGYEIRWTAANLVVRKPGLSGSLLDLGKSAQAQWKDIAAHPGDRPYTQEFTFRLLSVVGPLLSIDEEDDCDCGGAHPDSFRRFHVVDLSHRDLAGPLPVPLSSLFSPEDIRRAMIAVPEVQEVLGNPEAVPLRLPILLHQFEGATINSGDCSYALDNHLLESYAFAAYANGAVDVELSLPFSAEACRGDIKIVKLNLPVPPRLKPWFEAAAQRKEGFLASSRNSLAITPEAKTYVRFTNATTGH